MIPGLFEDAPRSTPLAPGAVLLGGFALPLEAALLDATSSRWRSARPSATC